ncbi:MAG: hypothetical protein ACO3GP_07970 [Candidatus Limnocylindrus sp.]
MSDKQKVFIPVEYGVINNGVKVRMVLQTDYAELKSAYFQLLIESESAIGEIEHLRSEVRRLEREIHNA